MRTKILHARRWLPVRTQQRFAALPGAGTAYLTDTLGLKQEHYPGGPFAWQEVGAGPNPSAKFVRLWDYARAGYDILYRLPSVGGRCRVFVRHPNGMSTRTAP